MRAQLQNLDALPKLIVSRSLKLLTKFLILGCKLRFAAHVQLFGGFT
jgi:hypothetical protein